MVLQEVAARELWRDTRTGAIWAVEKRDGRVAACSGPYEYGAAIVDRHLVDDAVYSRARAAWLDRHADRFRVWEPRYDEIWPT